MSQGLSIAPKPGIRKKWRKSTIELVPTVSQPQKTEASEKAKDDGEIDIPLKLPRAMRSTLTNNNQLKERNADEQSEAVDNREANTRNGKENKGS